MVLDYICGYTKSNAGNNSTDYHFDTAILPEAFRLYSVWEGLNFGREIDGWGFKGKCDKNKNFYFLMVDNPLVPTNFIIVKVTFDFVNNTAISVVFDLDELVDPDTFSPNQLTIDNDLNIFIAGGNDGTVYKIIASDIDPVNWILSSYKPQGSDKLLCVTLSWDHTKVAYYWDDAEFAFIEIVNTADLSVYSCVDIGQACGLGIPINFETVSSNVNNPTFPFNNALGYFEMNDYIIGFDFNLPINVYTTHLPTSRTFLAYTPQLANTDYIQFEIKDLTGNILVGLNCTLQITVWNTFIQRYSISLQITNGVGVTAQTAPIRAIFNGSIQQELNLVYGNYAQEEYKCTITQFQLPAGSLVLGDSLIWNRCGICTDQNGNVYLINRHIPVRILKFTPDPVNYGQVIFAHSTPHGITKGCHIDNAQLNTDPDTYTASGEINGVKDGTITRRIQSPTTISEKHTHDSYRQIFPASIHREYVFVP